ncbi:MAG: chemotaxis response regulator protein-glutamate methylesterase [Myxococcota bacterium]|nr:chemotaxis response regulator protein-glutamate methylesterase [Myxococcota bacterium]
MTLQVLVVDDSAVVRQMIQAVLSEDPGISVTVAADPLIAMQKMERVRPDVIVLDLEMPRMDGLTFLRKLMAEDPIPVVVCSSAVGSSSRAALRALDEGAVDIVRKPALGVAGFLRDSAVAVLDTVRAAASVGVRRRVLGRPAPSGVETAPVGKRRVEPAPVGGRRSEPGSIVALGASTGGPEALASVLGALPPDAPGCVVVQHMPEGFTAAFAERLDATCRIAVKEAAAGDRVRPGSALIAPGDRHLVVRRHGVGFRVALDPGPLVSRHRPSVDMLFRSVADAAGARGVGVLLTGMGSDGAEGMLELKESGARTIAQDESTSVVFGMPGEAIKRGAVDEVVPLAGIPDAILRRRSRREA